MEAAGSGREYVEGCKLAIKTTLGDDIEGHVLTYDKNTNIVVIHILLQISTCCSTRWGSVCRGCCFRVSAKLGSGNLLCFEMLMTIGLFI